MSAGGAFGGNRGARPVPPEKGVFPLDHLHECDVEKKDYLTCLKSTGAQSEKCRMFSKKYLECRMESEEAMPKEKINESFCKRKRDDFEALKLMSHEPKLVAEAARKIGPLPLPESTVLGEPHGKAGYVGAWVQ